MILSGDEVELVSSLDKFWLESGDEELGSAREVKNELCDCTSIF